MVITSKQNLKVKTLSSLQDKRHREQLQLSFVEGEKFVAELVKNKMHEEIFVSDNFVHPPPEAVILSESVFKSVSSVATPQGILATFKTNKFVFEKISGNFLILENIQEPTNLGAIIRSAVAFNFKEILLINCTDEFSPRATSASAGQVFKAKFKHINLNDLNLLLPQNAIIVAGDMHGENCLNLKKQEGKIYGLLVGNEGRGVSEEAKSFCHKTLKIKMENDVESLNVAVACSILMFEILK